MAQEVPRIDREAREDVEGELISSPRSNQSTQGSDAQTAEWLQKSAVLSTSKILHRKKILRLVSEYHFFYKMLALIFSTKFDKN